MTAERGDIHCLPAYAQAKMLNHSGWPAFLDRNQSPMDFDFVFNDRYAFKNLYCELDRNNDRWCLIDPNKSQPYKDAIRKGEHCAIVCCHNVPLEREIDTFRDITSFQVMVFDLCAFRVSRVIEGVEPWQAFVRQWFKNPDGLRGVVIEKSVPL